MTAQAAGAADTYELAKSGTIYWTLSLYIEADRAAAALGLKPGARIGPETFAGCREVIGRPWPWPTPSIP